TYDQITFRRSMVRELSIIAALTAVNNASEIAFEDSSSATRNLTSLRAHAHIQRAAILLDEGKTLATYEREDVKGRPWQPLIASEGHLFARDCLSVCNGIRLTGEQIGLVYLESDFRELHARFWRFTQIVILVFVVTSLLAFLLAFKLQQIISRPIFHLANIATIVGEQKNYSVRASKHGQDELGRLIDRFNEMLDQIQSQDSALKAARDDLEQRVKERTRELEEVHYDLMRASRQAGMAEVATSVLHNVGNVLNSVNVSGGLLCDRLKKSKATQVGQVAGLLREHSANLAEFLTNDPRGQRLPLFMSQLAERLDKEREGLLKEVALLRERIDHIKDIVAMQQSYAKMGGVVETVDVANLVEDALRINATGLERDRVQILREYVPGELPVITVERHKALQILVNLIANARHACAESGISEKRLTLRIDAGENVVRIAVIDNGVGIPPENLTRIFNHGFTTRKDGHGFGLHSGALAAKEMGGALHVQSDGAGKGATFTLELPRSRPPRQSDRRDGDTSCLPSDK
ncbi:MAG TPA: ATP-binding protein, partial [Clostridia bacterium]|nr:ATP-binding protein [Clostridia bacterium]